MSASLAARARALLPRAVRFGIVGIGNTLVDLAVLNVLLYAFGTDERHALLFPAFATVSFVAATLNSFYWNRNWTFRAKEGSVTRDLSRFYLVTVVSFLVNVGVSTLLVWLHPFPTLSQTVWANVAKLAAVGISLLINFVGYQKLVFRER